jgi:hypothetical protein
MWRSAQLSLSAPLLRVANAFADFRITKLADGSEIAASEFTWES